MNSFYDLLDKAKKDNSVMVYASSAATYGSLPSPQTILQKNKEYSNKTLSFFNKFHHFPCVHYHKNIQ